VEFAEPDAILHTTDTVPNDPRYSSLWGMTNIHAPAAWDYYTGDPSFVVASIDTGVDITHPDLAANIWTNPGEIDGNGIDDDHNGYIDDLHGWDFAYNDNNPADVYSHGTHTSGTLGAVGNNAVGVTGVAWNVKIMPLKFLDDSGYGATSDAIAALQYAVDQGVRLSNNSWGGGPYEQALYNAIASAGAQGHLFVAAAGNGGADQVGDDNDASPFYPASYPLDNIISVAAITSTDARASFSNYGLTSVDLGAPGSNITSTLPGSGYGSASGTSMATPHVTGVAALLFGKYPTWTYAQVKARILSTARPIAALAGKTATGATLDAGAALAPIVSQPPAAPSGLAGTAPTYDQVNLTWTDNANTESGFRIDRCLDSACANLVKTITVGPNVTAYSDTGLIGGMTYWYRVLATNIAGNSAYSNMASVTTPPGALPPPAAPSALSARTGTTFSASLTWVDNANNETGMWVIRCQDSACKTVLKSITVAPNTTSYTDTGLSAATTYYYRVRAYNNAGYSAYSNTVSIKTKK
jgi:subtilisin family serine protease